MILCLKPLDNLFQRIHSSPKKTKVLTLSRLMGHPSPPSVAIKLMALKCFESSLISFFDTAGCFGGKTDQVLCVSVALFSSFIRSLVERLPCCSSVVSDLDCFPTNTV